MAESDASGALTRQEAARARIIGETAKIAWRELQKFFAQGIVVRVKPGLDLVEVAFEVSSNNERQVENWMNNGDLAAVCDEQAREWLDANALMWAVVVRPWVLVQPVLNEQ